MRARCIVYNEDGHEADSAILEARFTPESVQADLMLRDLEYGVLEYMLDIVQGEQFVMEDQYIKVNALLMEFWLPDGWTERMSTLDETDMDVISEGLLFLMSSPYSTDPSYEGTLSGRAHGLEIYDSQEEREAAMKRIAMLHAAIDDPSAVPALQEALIPLWDPWLLVRHDIKDHKTAVVLGIAGFVKTLRKHYLPGDRVVLACEPVVLELEEVEPRLQQADGRER